MGEEEYTMTEAEIQAVFDLWKKEARCVPEGFATDAEIEAGNIEPQARTFLDYLSAVRCERIGL